MAVFRCGVCGEWRARRDASECTVCYLVRVLAEEHVAGEHDAVVNASCIDCTQTPERVAEIHAHRVAMRRTERSQEQRRERLKVLYGNTISDAPARPMKAAAAEVRERHATGQIDHSQCDHERTAKARATCRRARSSV